MPSSSASLIRALTLSANLLANKAREITSQRGPGGYPPEIPSAIEVDQAIVTETGGSITVFTKNRNEERNADITIAFELGSGLTGPKGQRYLIAPKKEGGLLAFEWPEAQNIAPGRPPGTRAREVAHPTGELRDGYPVAKAILPYVMHPGIRPNPFLWRAFVAVKDQIAEIIADSFMVNIPMHDKQIEVIR